MAAKARFQHFSMVLPEKGPLTVPDKITFVAATAQEIDLSQLIENGWMDYISGVYVDNISNTGDLTLVCNGTNQNFFIPAGYSGYYNLLLPNPPKVTITSTANASVTFQWYNVPVFPIIIPGPNAVGPTANVNIASVGGTPVTDPLPVSGPLTDTELRASAVSVTINGVAYTNRSIANLSGASEQLMAANAARRILIVQNVAANPMAINLTGGAAALNTAGSINIPAGGSITLDNFPPTSAINIIGTVNDDVTAYEG